MVGRKELSRMAHTPIINAEGGPEEEEQPQPRDSSDGSSVHLSYASIRHGPSERVLSGHVFIANVSFVAL
jgi:hypothetical protein